MEEEEAKGSIVPLVLFTVVALLMGLGALAGIGIGIADSESAGVMASMVGCPVMAVAAAVFLGAVIGQLASKKTAVRIGVPIAVGVVGGIAGGFLTMLFFAMIWPML